MTGTPPVTGPEPVTGPADSSGAGLPVPSGAALAPLRVRYTHWLQLDEAAVLADRDEAAEDIRAMQLVLRLERGDPPSWHGAVAAAATAAAMLCLDPRAEPGGEWFDAVAAYCRGHIRKVTRRARATQWDAVGELPSVLVERAGAEVRAVLPGPVADLDKRIAKLQVGGTDAPVDPPLPPLDPPALEGPITSAPPRRLEVWIPPEPVMTLGKTMAQSGHAGMIAAALLAGDDPTGLATWTAAGCPAEAIRVDGGQWAALLDAVAEPVSAWDDGLLVVRDAGFTEIAAGTITVIARAPRTR